MRPWLAIAAAVLVAGCSAARQVAVLDLDALAAADREFLNGCHACLVRARDEYARLAQGRYRAALLPRLFEAELLIAVRERELALDEAAIASLERARAVAAELPPIIEADRYIAVAEALPADGLGWPRAKLRALVRAHPEFVRRVDDEIEALGDGPLRPAARHYLALAIDCAYTGARDRLDARTALRSRVDPDSPPLVIYRAALCSQTGEDALLHVRTVVPDFAEASYAAARIAIARIDTPSGMQARALVDEALARFPESSAVLHLTGNYYRAVRDYEASLRFYGDALKLEPRHEDVWLGRTISLTMLGQRDDAIAAATHMIDSDMDNPAEPYYWRAWNYRIAGDLGLAREDIDRARTFRVAADVLTLAGMIEHDQDDLTAARQDLTRVRTMPRQEANCVALWYLSSVNAKLSIWGEAASGFEAAMGCYENAVASGEEALAAVAADDGIDPAYRASQMAALEQALADDRRQFHASAMNAAKFFAVTGDLPKAVRFADTAAADPLLAEELAAVREYIARRQP